MTDEQQRRTHTEAQWELSQGEVHDSRGFLAAIAGGLKNVDQGLWTYEVFSEWFWDAKEKHEGGQLTRFKNVTRRYGYAETQGYR